MKPYQICLMFIALSSFSYLGFSIGTASADGQAIYVDNKLISDCLGNNYSIANRNCSGSDGIAFNSLLSAYNNASAGDIVLIREGNYTTTTYYAGPKNSGTEYAYITFKNYPGEHVYIKGTWKATGSSCTGSPIYLYNRAYIVIEGLEISNYCVCVSLPGNSTNIILRNLELHDCINGISIQSNSSNILIENSEGYRNSRYRDGGCGVNIKDSSNVLVNNFYSHDNDDLKKDSGDGDGFCASVGTNLNLTFINCIARNNSEDGFDLTGMNVNLINSKSYDNFVCGIKLWRRGTPIQPAYYTVINTISFSNGETGLTVANAPNISVYNSIFYNNGAQGIWLIDYTGTDTIAKAVVHNNIITGNGFYSPVDNSSGYLGFHIGTSWTMWNNSALDYNIYYNNSRNTTPAVEGMHSLLNADPRFIPPSRGDFRLLLSSPAIDGGIDLSGIFNYDFAGMRRPVDGNDDGIAKWDIGAYEYSATPPTALYLDINSTEGCNTTLEDLNCIANISDLNDDKFNVTVIWYRNGIPYLTLYYNNSYTSGTLFVSTLTRGNLSLGDKWNCGMTLYDVSNYSVVDSTSLTIITDIVPPKFTNLANKIIFYNESLNYDIGAFDVSGVSCFSVNDTRFNVDCSGLLTNATNLGINLCWLKISVSDTLGNTNSKIIYIDSINTSDLTPPNMSIIYPQYNANYSSVSQMNYTVLDNVEADTCWYSTNNGATNSSSVPAGTNFTNVASSQGINKWIVYCNDTSNNINSSSLFFMVDGIAPDISFIPPTPENGAIHKQNSIPVYTTSNDTYTHYVFADFDSSLLLWMRMDDVNGSGDPIDLSSYGHNGSKSGNAKPTDCGKFGKGFGFDGAQNTMITTGVRNRLTNQPAISVSAWVKPTDAVEGLDVGVARQGTTTNKEVFYIRRRQYNFYQFLVHNTSGDYSYAISSGMSDINSWTHVVGVYNGTNVLLYINGVLQRTIGNLTGNTEDSSNENMRIGVEADDGAWRGIIDDVLVFNRSLSAQEILALYNAKTNQYYNTFTNLGYNTHTVIGYAADQFGNIGQTETRSITVDTSEGERSIPPTGPGSSGPSASSGSCTAGQTKPCGIAIGRCNAGTQTCTNGQWGECTGLIGPVTEICNGIDDDCDGQADEGLQCDCIIGQTKPCGLETGACKPGYRMCTQGQWASECIDETGPTAEVCGNGIDDDCDGQADEAGCILAASLNCSDGLIQQACICQGSTYASGYCYNGYHFETQQIPDFPWQVLSFIGGGILSAFLLFVVVREVRHFSRIHGQIRPEEQKKARLEIKPAKKGKIDSVTDISGSPNEYMDKEAKVSGYLKFSNRISGSEFWYSFYDQSSTIALKSVKELKEGYAELDVVIKKTQLGYVYAEAG